MSALPPNPNDTQNRIPDNDEITFLREAASRKQKVIDELSRAVDHAWESYEEIKKEHAAQALIMERLQSKLHIVKEEAEGFKRTRAGLEDEMIHLRGLLHPIRRCGDENLRLIFESCATGSFDSFAASTRLSHVCRRWRNLAISTPWLWHKVTFRTREPTKIARSRTEAFRSRVKGVAADITFILDRIGMEKRTFLERIRSIPFSQIYSVKTISSLQFYIVLDDDDPSLAFEGICVFPDVEFGLLKLEVISIEEPEIPLVLDKFVARFGRFRKLSLRYCSIKPPVSASLVPVLENIKELDLPGCHNLAIEMVGLCSQLETLTLGPFTSISNNLDGESSIFILSRLSSMSLDLVPFPWPRFQCPNLSHLVFNRHSDDLGIDAFWEFLSRATSLTDVAIIDCDAAFLAELARTSPQVERLEFSMADFTILALLAEKPVFPYLRELKLKYFFPIVKDLSLEIFEALLRSRCLPRAHPDSTMDPMIPHSLHRFSITVIAEHPAQWKRSAYISSHFRPSTEFRRGGREVVCYHFFETVPPVVGWQLMEPRSS